MMRATLLFLPLALLLTGCEFDGDNWGSSDRFKEDFHMTYPLKNGGRVSVENFNGSVEVLAWDRDEVDVSGTRYAKTKELLDQLKVDVAPSAEAVRIRTLRPPSEGSRWRGGYGVRYVVRVPRRTELDRIESSNGHLHAEGTEGNARLKTTNGGVKVNTVRGLVTATTTNGGMELRDVTGDADLHTTNGGIRVELQKGSVTAETTNGGVRLALVSTTPQKAIRAETTNGNIEIQLPNDHANDVHAESTNGNITVRMPGNAKATVRARTSNAKVSSDFDVATTFSNESKNRLEGTIGGGGPLVELSTSNGGVRIERN
jgi:hypothetical protein